MKVVLFCGGMGTRLREYSDQIPKPLVPVGGMPILWHIMKYYASFGHTDFILCLGYKGEAIRQFFLEYSEAIAGDLAAGPDASGRGMTGADAEGLAHHLRRHRPTPTSAAGCCGCASTSRTRRSSSPTTRRADRRRSRR